jgi:hypothetical protein
MENCVVIEERGTGKLRRSLGDGNRCSSSYCAGRRVKCDVNGDLMMDI